MKERATELEFLRYFYENTNYDIFDREIKKKVMIDFQKQTEKLLPEGYSYGDEE